MFKLTDHLEAPVSPNLSNSSDGSNNYYDTPDPSGIAIADPIDLGVGSVVEVAVKNEPHYGVIRWIGVIPEDRKNRKVAGIEMEEEIGCSDGTFNARRYFQCNPKRALFVGLNQCQLDGRFQDLHPHSSDNKAKCKLCSNCHNSQLIFFKSCHCTEKSHFEFGD